MSCGTSLPNFQLMSGSGIPPEWVGRDPYFDDPRTAWLDSPANRNVHRTNASPGRAFGNSPYSEDRMSMSGFPYYHGFDDFHQFPPHPMSMDPWPDFESEFHPSQPHTPNSATGGRRIPIQVVKHPVTMLSSRNSTSQDFPSHAQSISEQSSSSQTQSQRFPRQHRPTLSTSSLTSHRDPSSWREWYSQGRVPSEGHISYQNSGATPISMQDLNVCKDGASSTSDTDSNSLGGQSKPLKVHRIPITKTIEPNNQTKHTDFASLKPSVENSTAIPLYYQSLPNRPFPMTRDMPVYSGAPLRAMPPDRPSGESEISTPTEVTAPPFPSSKPSPTPSEKIDKNLAELAEIRSQIDTYSSLTKDKTYLYLEDRLDKLLLKFDGIETGGDDIVRQKRKQAVQETLETISTLEKKLLSTEEHANTSNTQANSIAPTSNTVAPVDKVEESDDVNQVQVKDLSITESNEEQQEVHTELLATPTALNASVLSNPDKVSEKNEDNQRKEPTSTVKPANS